MPRYELNGRLAIVEDLGMAIWGDKNGEFLLSCVLPEGVAAQYEHTDVGAVITEINRVPVKGKSVSL